jgi:hypothetical protein
MCSLEPVVLPSQLHLGVPFGHLGSPNARLSGSAGHVQLRYEAVGVWVEIAERGIDAFNQRDGSSFAALMTADGELFQPMHGTVEGGGYRGREGFEAY